ncbi:MAG TPA: MmcQ/YjbR family DNA-binding protein [Rhizomicrobium sp.]
MAGTKKKPASKGVTAAQFKKIALSFPEAIEKPSYGAPAVFIAKKFFTRLRAQDNSVVFIVADLPTRDMMLELDPKTYFITDHYKDYPSVLVRMERITPDELKRMLDRRWRHIAPKKLIKEIDEKVAGAPQAPAKKPKRKKAR